MGAIAPWLCRAFYYRCDPTVSPIAIYDWLKTTIETQLESRTDVTFPAPPVVVIGFSAGVVGAAGAAAVWNQTRAEQSVQSPLPIGGKVARLIAVDGWGVPVLGVPVTRISHDRFTHMSSLLLGAGDVNFYADPPVAHLDLWRSPEAAQGWQVDRWALPPGDGTAITAADFLQRQLHAEWNQAFNWRYSG